MPGHDTSCGFRFTIMEGIIRGRLGTILGCSLAVGMLAVCRSVEASRTLSGAKNFVCYYGGGKEELLSQFDIVILESRNYHRPSILKIKSKGAKVIGYLSLGEDPKLRKGYGDGVGGYASYYLDEDKDGRPDGNPNWGSYYTNPADPKWVELVSRLAKEAVMKGCDGLFLDTLDTVEVCPSTHKAMVKLVEHLRASFEDAPVVANRGIAILGEIASAIDGEMIESLTSTYDWGTKSYRRLNDEEIEWTSQLARKVARIQKENGFVVLILDYTQKDDIRTMQHCRERAERFGFICSFSNIQLNEIYPRDVTGGK